MIKLNELRPGNRLLPLRVLDPENIPLMGYFITPGWFGAIENDVYAQKNNWEYAPLTIERALACGFTQTTGWDGQGNNYYGLKIGREETKIYWRESADDPNGGTFTLYNYHNRVWIPYVHTLQNLFFALTGQELQIP